MNTLEKQLSESLLAACKAAGIEEPRYIAQDKDEPYVWHYDLKPDTDDTKELDMWAVDNGNATKIHHPPYAEDWKESLLEWVEPQGEPLADVLARHPEHVADDSKMVSDDARKLGYRKMIAEYAGRRTEAQVYEIAWRDALAWWDNS
jgi:hypothetical protein